MAREGEAHACGFEECPGFMVNVRLKRGQLEAGRGMKGVRSDLSKS